MKKIFTRLAGVSFLLTFCVNLALAQTQTTISGTVTDKATKEALAGVAITVKGKTIGTSTNENGQYSLATTEPTPFTITISYIGFGTLEHTVTGSATGLNFELETQAILGQEVVVSASRTPEKILESPVSIERVGAASIREMGAPSFYDALTNLKGVEVSTQSVTFKSVNTRGFNANGNVRFNQLVDGMDNQAPGLNFSVGNVVGISELDVDNVELLPGASSALYGAGGTNGTLLMTSKSPFTYPGLSAQLKVGLNHVDGMQRSQTSWHDAAFRYAKAWGRFAVKANVSYTDAQDWQAQDYGNFDRIARTPKAGDRNTDPRYDGVNVYGDEPNLRYPTLSFVANAVQTQTRAGILAATGNTVDIVALMNASLPANATQAQIGAFIGALPAALRPAVTNLVPFYFGLRNNVVPGTTATRTGYLERDLVDYGASSFKTSGSLHYKLSSTVEAIAQANWGSGTSVYTGTDRYSLSNFNIGQYKLEIKGQDFMLRGYTTQERAGDAYNATLLASLINEAWKPSATWFQEYTAAYSQARLGGATDEQANVAGRTFADRNRPAPGSAQFNTLKRTIANSNIGPLATSGAKFNDRSNLYHYEGMYNFTNALNNAVELVVGASYRQYDLNSDGTIFDDLNRELNINEYGAYGQIGKKFGDVFKLTGAVRYDKNENFDGRFTPRITGVYTIAPNNNIRASYQTGFRNPTTQNQFIDLAVAGGTIRLIGGLPELLNKYNLYNNKAYTDASYRQFVATGNAAVLQTYTFDAGGIRPERVQSWELGYKGLLSKNFLIDVYGYYSNYKDYITGVDVYQNTQGGPAGLANPTRYNVPVNSTDEISSYGFAAGLDYSMSNWMLNGNVSYNQIGDLPATYVNDFNTPKVRFNLGVGNKQVFKNVGFNLAYRWQDEFYWNSTFASGPMPAFGTLDGQINLKIPAYKTMVKFGASNLTNNYFRTSYGNPAIGGMYYISFTFDQFMR